VRSEVWKCDWCGGEIGGGVIRGGLAGKDFCSYTCAAKHDKAMAEYNQALAGWQRGLDHWLAPWIQAYHRESPKPLPPLAPYERPKSGSDPSSQPCP
jgi:hypothetical protein